MAVPAILMTIGKVVTSPYTTATLLGANTVMNGVQIKQNEDIKSGVAQIKSDQQNEIKLLKQISITTAASLTVSDLDDYFTNLNEENNEAAAVPAPAPADAEPAWLGSFTKIIGEVVKQGVADGLSAAAPAPAPTEDKK